MTTEITEVTTTEPEVKNPAALLAKNRELLRELAEVKAELQAAQEGQKAAQEAQSKAASDLYNFRVTEPFDRVMRELSHHPGLMAKAINDLLEVRLDESNNPVLFDKQGKPLTWTKKDKSGFGEEVSVSLNRDSLTEWINNAFEGNPDSPAALMFKPQGTGAVGASSGMRHQPTPPKPATPAAVPTPQFGLR